MSDKVRLPKEIAAIADSIKNLGDEMFNLPVVLEYLDMKNRRTLDDFLEDARHENWRLWYSALVNGYEVEMTREDKVRNYAMELLRDHQAWKEAKRVNVSPFGQELLGCKNTLDMLGIKIIGVNAE